MAKEAEVLQEFRISNFVFRVLYFESGRAVMTGDSNDNEKQAVRMELKYCERCGGLWLRKYGAEVVYCGSCQREVADLPVPKKKPQRVKVPVGPRAVMDEYGIDGTDGEARGDTTEFEAAGGVA